jgi:hypothetical protein
VIDSLRIFYAVLGVSLFVPIAAGLHSQRPGVPEALAAIGVGITVLFVVQLSALPSASRLFDATLIAIAASGVAFGVVFLMRGRRRSPSQQAPEATD